MVNPVVSISDVVHSPFCFVVVILFCSGSIHSCVQDFLLALYWEITPGEIRGPYGMWGMKPRSAMRKTKCFAHYTNIPALISHSLKISIRFGVAFLLKSNVELLFFVFLWLWAIFIIIFGEVSIQVFYLHSNWLFLIVRLWAVFIFWILVFCMIMI